MVELGDTGHLLPGVLEALTVRGLVRKSCVWPTARQGRHTFSPADIKSASTCRFPNAAIGPLSSFVRIGARRGNVSVID